MPIYQRLYASLKRKQKEKALHTAGVKKEEDFHFLFVDFFGAMCRACIQLL